MARLDLPEQPDRKEPPDPKDLRVQREPLDLPDLQGPLEQQALKDQLVRKVPQGLLGRQGQWERRERKVCPDPRDLLEQQERLAPLDLLDRWEQ